MDRLDTRLRHAGLSDLLWPAVRPWASATHCHGRLLPGGTRNDDDEPVFFAVAADLGARHLRRPGRWRAVPDLGGHRAVVLYNQEVLGDGHCGRRILVGRHRISSHVLQAPANAGVWLERAYHGLSRPGHERSLLRDGQDASEAAEPTSNV